MVHSQKKSSPLVIAVSWIVVLIPLGWGVVQSVVKSLPLFSVCRRFQEGSIVRGKITSGSVDLLKPKNTSSAMPPSTRRT